MLHYQAHPNVHYVHWDTVMVFPINLYVKHVQVVRLAMSMDHSHVLLAVLVHSNHYQHNPHVHNVHLVLQLTLLVKLLVRIVLLVALPISLDCQFVTHVLLVLLNLPTVNHSVNHV